MFIVSVVSETLLYLCFSLLMGSFILYLIPSSLRPEIKVPKAAILASVLGIALFSFIPVLRLILYLYKDIGLGMTFQSVLTQFEVGKSWIGTGIISLILFVYLIPLKLDRKPVFSITGLILTFLLICLLGWSSHAASISKWPGFFTHSAHFLAISIWLGMIFVIGWFAKDYSHWLQFLKWFSPLAIICLVTVIATGIALMTFGINLKDYANTWILSYGQTLLIKHLAIIPLLGFAFINSISARNRISVDPDFNPVPWVRLESIVALIIFSVTGALSQESPPHNISVTVKEEGVSQLFKLVNQGSPNLPLHFTPGIASVSLAMGALLFLYLIIASFSQKEAPKFVSFIIAILFITSAYFAIMLGVS